MDLILDEKQIEDNYNQLLSIIKKSFSGNRYVQLMKLFNDFEDAVATAPASSNKSFHNAFPGGLVDHTTRVIQMALRIAEVWKEFGTGKDKWTTESLIFCALVHDLGKIGDENGEMYIPNPSDWHVRNQGKIYEENPDIEFMDHPQRSLYLLQKYDIDVTQDEYLTILLHHGMYTEANRFYLTPFSEGRKIKSNMAIILHQADVAASRIEYEQFKQRG